MARKGVGYGRYSRLGKRNAEDLRTLGAQDATQDEIAQREGIDLIARLTDQGKSGGSLNGRDGLAEALRMIEDGEASVLVAAKLSRLARSMPDLRKIIERVSDAGGSIILGDLGRIDMTSATGKLIVQLLGVLAEFELDLAREHGLDARTAAIADGVHIGRLVPWGYLREDSKLRPCPTRGPVVTEVFAMRASGSSWREIGAFAKEKTGDVLQPPTLNKMLANRVYLGEVKSGALVCKGAHLPLIDEETFEAVAAARPIRSTRKHETLLAGLMTCSGCGRPMTYRASKQQAQYICQRNSKDGRCPAPVGVSPKRADEAVEASFLSWAGGSYAGDPKGADDVAQAVAALETAEAEQVAWLERPVAGTDPAVWQKMTDKRQAAVDAAKAQLAKLRSERRLDVLRYNVADVWQDASVAERRQMIASALGSIVVRPSSGRGRTAVPFAERAEIVWRDRD